MNEHASNPAAIERELAETRARLGNHLEELARRLSPGQLLDEGLGYLRHGQGATFVRNLGADVRDNPLPVALTGIGLAWLAITAAMPRDGDGSRSRAVVPYEQAEAWRGAADGIAERARSAGEAVSRAVEETEEAYRDRVAEARARILGLQRDASEAASAFADRVQQALDTAQETAWRGTEALADAAQRGRDFAARASNSVAETISDNPLLLGALGVTAGVLLGALLPRTEQEAALVAPAASAARHVAGEVIERGARAADAAASAAYQAARE